jgi:hypothetical protein
LAVSHDNAVREYLMPAPDTFWEWRDEGEVIAWKDGKTIAFRHELRTILSWLVPHGLPSLGSIALVLSATHDAWNATGSEAQILTKLLQQPVEGRNALGEVLGGLNSIHALDRGLRTAVRSKAVLVEMVLENCRTIAEPDAAAMIVEAMYRGLGELVAPLPGYIESPYVGTLLLARDLAQMLPGLKRFNGEALRLRLATGIDELPAIAEIELPPSEVARALIDDLQDDLELGGLSRIAKQLLAVASLPRRLETQDHYHTGGFSDIANRGSMERLLISELANDDLTLAVRVAMNEALYLRREVPPSTPHHHRAVLIDAGIRTWGVPRVFATAVALAFMASTAKGGSYACFRANRNSVEHVDLATRNGLVQHLSVLETGLSPAAAIPAFLQQFKDDAETAEPILLMTEDALRDSAVQQSLRQSEMPQLFVATVNRDGEFRLAEPGRYGMKLLREARLDIDSLLRGRPRLLDKRPDNLPAIFAVHPFPLLLPHKVKPPTTTYVDNWGVVSTTGDGRLMRWQHPGRGARQLSDDIRGRILWTAPAPIEGHLSLVVGGPHVAYLLRISDENDVVDRVRLRLERLGENYCARNGVLFFISETCVDVLDMHSGFLTQTLQLPSQMRWNRDRFFQGSNGTWHALSYDGRSACLEIVQCVGLRRELPPLITMFERPGVDGPIGVMLHGNLFSTATGEIRRVGHPDASLPVPWIAPDGRRMYLRGYSGACQLIDTESLKLKPAVSPFLDDRIWPVIGVRQPSQLRHKFKAVGIDPWGRLTLESRRGQLVYFALRAGRPVFAICPERLALRARRGFEKMDGFDPRYTLFRASWPDGSRAILDSRGLLHLASSDQSTPEFTLVLAEDEELSGWCADGRMWGEPYFIGDASTAQDSAAVQRELFASTVGRFVERLNA